MRRIAQTVAGVVITVVLATACGGDGNGEGGGNVPAEDDAPSIPY